MEGSGSAERENNAFISCHGEDVAVMDGLFLFLPGKWSPDKLLQQRTLPWSS